MRNCLFSALFVLAMTSVLPAADDFGADTGDSVVAPVRAAAASGPVDTVPDYAEPTTSVPKYEAPAASQVQPVKSEKADGPGYTQLGGQIILQLDRDKTELSLYENSAYVIMTQREGIVANNVSNRLLVEIEESDGGGIAFRTLKPGVMWLTFYGEKQERYVVEITITGDTRTLNSQLKELYPDSNIQAIKVGKGVLLRGEVSKPEHVAEVIEIAEQHYPKALNQLKVEAKTRYIVPPKWPPVAVPVYQQPVGGSTQPAPWRAVPQFRPHPHGQQFGLQPFLLEVDWQQLAEAKVDLVRAIHSLEGVPEEWAPQSTARRSKAKQPATIRFTIPRSAAGNAIRQLIALKGVELVNLPAMTLSSHKPARTVVHKMMPVVRSRVVNDGRKVLETSYQRVGTTLTLTTDRDSLEQANLDFQVNHTFQIDRVKVGADRDVSASIGTRQFSGTVRLKSNQAVLVAETGPHAATTKKQATGKGLVILFVPYYGPIRPVAANSVMPAVIYQPAAVTPIEGQRGLRDSVRELRGDVRALRKDVKKLLKLLEDQTSAVPSVAPTVGSVRRRIKESKTDLLEFHISASGPCQKMGVMLDEQAARGYSVRRLHIDKFPELARGFGVTSVPTIIAFSKGKEDERWVGMLGKEELTRIVDEYAPRRTSALKSSRQSSVSPAERKIHRALEQEVSLELDRVPLREAVRVISKQYDLSIALDNRGLIEEGVTADVPVTASARGVKLRSVLNLILDPLQLAHQMRDEVLVITSKQRTQGEMVVVTYPVADLVVPLSMRVPAAQEQPSGGVRIDPTYRFSVQPPAVDFDKLMATIRSTVQPNSWHEVGGAASMQAYETTLSLVIRQTSKAHEEIADLIEQLRRLQDMQVTVEPRYLHGIPDQLWEKIQGQLDSRDAGSAAKGVAILSSEEAKLVLEAVRSDDKSKIMQLPKVTLFNGQSAVVAKLMAGEQQKSFQLLQFQPVISADRRHVRLSLRLRGLMMAESLTSAFVRTVPDGKTLLIDVAEREGNAVGVPISKGSRLFKNVGAKQRAGRQFLLVRPRILVQEEKELLLLGIPVKKQGDE